MKGRAYTLRLYLFLDILAAAFLLALVLKLDLLDRFSPGLQAVLCVLPARLGALVFLAVPVGVGAAAVIRKRSGFEMTPRDAMVRNLSLVIVWGAWLTVLAGFLPNGWLR